MITLVLSVAAHEAFVLDLHEFYRALYFPPSKRFVFNVHADSAELREVYQRRVVEIECVESKCCDLVKGIHLIGRG